MKTVACIIARTNSTRLPQKVLLDLYGKKLIEHIIERVKLVKGIDEIYIATSIHEDDKILGKIAEKNGVKVYYGSEKSVIDRMLDISRIEKANNVIRITGDNIFTDHEILEKLVASHKEHNAEYSRAEFLPLGVTGEVIKTEALKRCYESIDPNKSEYLFYYIFNPDEYNTMVLVPEDSSKKLEYSSLTVDTVNDFERTKYIFDNISSDVIKYSEIVELNKNKEIPNFNIDTEMSIKLPDINEMNYRDFRGIINKRINKSKKVFY